MSLPLTPFPELHTARLRLREISMADVPDLFVLRSNPEMMRFVPRPVHARMEETEELLSKVLHGQQEGMSWVKTRESGNAKIKPHGRYAAITSPEFPLAPTIFDSSMTELSGNFIDTVAGWKTSCFFSVCNCLISVVSVMLINASSVKNLMLSTVPVCALETIEVASRNTENMDSLFHIVIC